MKMYTMAGPITFQGKKLTDYEAGIKFLVELAKANPGLKFSDLGQTSGMSGISSLWRKTKNLVGDAWKGTTTVLDYVGDKLGSATRLISDEEVMTALQSGAAAYATGGASAAGEGLFSNLLGGEAGEKADSAIEQLGALFKKFGGGSDSENVSKAAFAFDDNSLPWVIAGGGVGVALLIMALKK